MALATSHLHRNIKGAIGDLIFRTYNGKTVVSLRPVYKNETNTEARRKSRGRFRDATDFASLAMQNPKQKAYYQQKARQLKVPNAYTAAITDFLRKARVVATTRSSFSAKKGDAINIHMLKKGFDIKQIKVALYDKKGAVLSEQEVKRSFNAKVFSFALQDDYPDYAGIKVTTEEPLGGKYTVEASEFVSLPDIKSMTPV